MRRSYRHGLATLAGIRDQVRVRKRINIRTKGVCVTGITKEFGFREGTQ